MERSGAAVTIEELEQVGAYGLEVNQAPSWIGRERWAPGADTRARSGSVARSVEVKKDLGMERHCW